MSVLEAAPADGSIAARFIERNFRHNPLSRAAAGKITSSQVNWEPVSRVESCTEMAGSAAKKNQSRDVHTQKLLHN
jgi:hypothetical protein